MYMKRFLAVVLLLSVALSGIFFTGCENKEEAVKETQPVVNTSDYSNSTKILKSYFDSFTEGDNPLYGTWQIEGFDYLSFIFRNDNFAELAIDGEGSFSTLEIDEKDKTLTTSFFIGLSGEYNYELSDNDKTLTLTQGNEKMVLVKQDDHNFIPKAPKKPKIDKNILGWWKCKDGMVYYFGKDGIMYSNLISSETCYTYDAQNGTINAVYNYGGEDIKTDLEYTLKNGKIEINGNKYKHFQIEN